MTKILEPEREENGNGNVNVANKKAKSKTPMLDNFGRDLTKLASEGKLDSIYGREHEIEIITQILNKRNKSNPILIGESGVGKTAVVEGLAIKIFKKETEMWLLDKRVIEINITSMVSGTKFRGDFEERMEAIIKEAEENDDVIVFIDEIHNAIGAGGASGSMDAANIIKPALSRGMIKCIGATTLEEYKKHVESDSAFKRRFQKVYIDEPSKEETELLINNIKERFENFHGVTYSSEIVKECINFADKYLSYGKFPDKAIDLLDEVGSRVKLKIASIPDSIRELEKALDETKLLKSEATKTQMYEEAAKYRDEERVIIQDIEIEKKEWQNKIKETKVGVTIEDMADIISSHTGIPANKLSESENVKMLNIANHLKEKVIGQDEAIIKVEESIQRYRLGLNDVNKPMSFLFLGVTGTGKTLLAKELASHMFNLTDSFIRIDMSEYGEAFSVAKLIGSPPGYVGHDDKGQLTEKIKNRPYSLILFDEIEKAHPDVFNVFLQILDEGKLTDSSGSVINFKNTIIIMTSNIGTRNVLEENRLGFGAQTDTLKDDKALVFKELEKFFRPEFINRIDEKVVFNPLGKEQIEIITKIELNTMLDRIVEKEYFIYANDEVIKNIAELDYDKKYGARPIKRAISERVGNLISKAVLKNEIKPKNKYMLVLKDGEISIEEVKKTDITEKKEVKIKTPKNARNKSK